jgi:hypothetical protein
VEGSIATSDSHGQAGRTRPESNHRQLGWGLRESLKPESHFQSGYGSEYSGKSARQKDAEAGTQTYFQSGSISGTVSYYRASLRLGRPVSALTDALRADQSAALCPENPGLSDDQSPAFLHKLKASPSIPFEVSARDPELSCFETGNQRKQGGETIKILPSNSLSAQLDPTFESFASNLH